MKKHTAFLASIALICMFTQARSQSFFSFGEGFDLNQISILDERQGRSEFLAGDDRTGLYVDYHTYVGASDLFPGYTVFGFEVWNSNQAQNLSFRGQMVGDWRYLTSFTIDGSLYYEDPAFVYQVDTGGPIDYVLPTSGGFDGDGFAVGFTETIEEGQGAKYWFLSRAPGYELGGFNVQSRFDGLPPTATNAGAAIPSFMPDYQQPVPEPSSMILLSGAGAIALTWKKRVRTQNRKPKS